MSALAGNMEECARRASTSIAAAELLILGASRIRELEAAMSNIANRKERGIAGTAARKIAINALEISP